ncbi:MAG: hypothetical protein JWO54_599 [Candidatus Saccharibacteria bacterium]|nr:hypothetical protein [Candidatus Saccharibacteria bacterium]MDB5180839.1 hypothetical protein [Candidatus Saccharibacteria bacterium]
MRSLVIAIDCDDVLVATTPYFISAYNNAFGTKVSVAQSRDESEEIWAASRDLRLERLDELTKTDEYFKIAPTSEESAVLQELSSDHSLHLVTARRREEHERTKRMIDRDLPGVFTSLDFGGTDGSKGEVCQRIGADVLIDDSIYNFEDALQRGMTKADMILFGDYPWNTDIPESLEGIRRCRDWDEVREAVYDIANAE